MLPLSAAHCVCIAEVIMHLWSICEEQANTILCCKLVSRKSGNCHAVGSLKHYPTSAVQFCRLETWPGCVPHVLRVRTPAPLWFYEVSIWIFRHDFRQSKLIWTSKLPRGHIWMIIFSWTSFLGNPEMALSEGEPLDFGGFPFWKSEPKWRNCVHARHQENYAAGRITVKWWMVGKSGHISTKWQALNIKLYLDRWWLWMCWYSWYSDILDERNRILDWGNANIQVLERFKMWAEIATRFSEKCAWPAWPAWLTDQNLAPNPPSAQI